MAEQPTGYGPRASSSASIPLFDGKREHFDDFVYKIKAALFELGIEDVLTADFQKQFESLTKRAALRDADATDAKSKLELCNTKRRQVARILITRLSSTVTDAMCKALPEAQHYEAMSIWEYLNKTYKISAVTRRAAENPELAVLNILQLRWNQDRPLLDYLRQVQRRLTPVLTHIKFVKMETGRQVVTSLVLRNVLNNIGENARYHTVCDKYLRFLVQPDEFPILGILDAFVSEVELVDAMQPSQKQQQFQRNKSRTGGNQATAKATAKATATASPAGKKHFDPQGRANQQGNAKKPQLPKVTCVDAAEGDEDTVNIECCLSALTHTRTPDQRKETRFFSSTLGQLITAFARRHSFPPFGLASTLCVSLITRSSLLLARVK